MGKKNGLVYQKLDEQGDKVILTNTYNTDDIEKDCYEQSKINPNGWTEEKNFRQIADIPLIYVNSDMDLLMFRKYLPIDDREARRYLQKFLLRNPQYKTNGGRFI